MVPNGFGAERMSNLPLGQDFPSAPGEWQIRSTVGRSETWDRIVFSCPRRPGQLCAVPLLPKRLANGAGWEWDASTCSLNPSINCVGGCGWHGWITNGEIRAA